MRFKIPAWVATPLLLVLAATAPAANQTQNNKENAAIATPEAVVAGLRQFYQQTAQADGSFRPGIDPAYLGMADSANSDLAAVTYACTIHKTFGWTLPHEAQTIRFLLSRQKETGEFFNVAGTADPQSAEGRTYNTTQGLVALHALGVKPRYDALPVFEEILKRDYKTLPAFSTSFFPLAYRCLGKPLPAEADREIRALMVQDETGYTNDHVAATFHASHYYSLVGEPTPKSREMVDRILRDQNPDGSWLLNMPSRDRHATFDAVFTLLHEGTGREDCRKAIDRAAKWALTCRNPDGGFGHYPGSTSDADAVYFQVGTLVMAGFLKPADPLPSEAELLSWGHLMPVRKATGDEAPLHLELPAWTGAVAFSHDGAKLATGSADHLARVWDVRTGRLLATFKGHSDIVSAVGFSSDDKLLVTCGYDQTIRIWDVATGEPKRTLQGHRGAVMALAFSPRQPVLASGGLDGTIKLWDLPTGHLIGTLEGHKSWVNATTFSPDGKTLFSASSDGSIKVWQIPAGQCQRTIQATKTEIRSLALSADGTLLAAGLRYGSIKAWNTADWAVRPPLASLSGDVWSLAFMPSGQLVSGSGDWNQPGQVTIWDLSTNKPLAQFQHTGEVLAIAVSQTTPSFAAGGGDKTVTVWRGQPAAKIDGHDVGSKDQGKSGSK